MRLSLLFSRTARRRNWGCTSPPASPHSWEVTEQISMETISRHIMGEKMTGSCQDGCMKGKSCLTNLTALCSEVAGSVVERRSAYSVFL